MLRRFVPLWALLTVLCLADLYVRFPGPDLWLWFEKLVRLLVVLMFFAEAAQHQIQSYLARRMHSHAVEEAAKQAAKVRKEHGI